MVGPPTTAFLWAFGVPARRTMQRHDPPGD
jgi:hypothetical protein